MNGRNAEKKLWKPLNKAPGTTKQLDFGHWDRGREYQHQTVNTKVKKKNENKGKKSLFPLHDYRK